MKELSESLSQTPSRGNGTPLAPHLPAPVNASYQVPVQNVSPPSSAVPQSSIQVDPRLMQEQAAIYKRHALIRNQGTGGGGAVQSRGLLGGQVQANVPSGHPVAGEMQSKFASMLYKLANRQTLSYDPATKTMTRQHLTPSLASNSLVSGGGTLASPGLAMGDIQAGTRAPVPSHVSDGPRAPLTAAESSLIRPSGGQSQAYSLHGGDVMSSSPAPGVAARPQATPRPIAAPPPIPAAARAAKSPIAAGAGAALHAAPKPPALPSLAGARSLVKRASMPIKKRLPAGGLVAGGAIAGGMLLHHKLRNKKSAK